jgi:hypothetical protein
VIEETKEAQAALAQLNIAFQNSGESARRSKQDLLDFSDAAQKSTTFSDEAITRAQTSLLRFGNVSGDVFGRARKDILDVSAALGIDLETASFAVGRALESPSQGLRQLRSLGVVFTDSQQKLIKSLEETGQTAKAQEILLQALEDRYEGAAKAARNTLGGALEGLKNAFGDLFESTKQGADEAAEGVNALSDTISDPAFKSAIQELTGELLSFAAAFVNVTALAISGLQKIAQYATAAQGALAPKTGIDALFSKQSELGRSLQNALDLRDTTLSSVERRRAEELITQIRAEIKKVENDLNSVRQGQGGPQAIGSRQAGRGGQFISADEQARLDDEAKAQAAARAPIDLVNITQARSNEAQKLLQQFNDATRTSLEKANTDFDETFSRLNALLKEGIINAEQFQQRLTVATLKYNEAVDIEPVKVSVQKVTETLSGQQLAVHEFVGTIKEGLVNLAQAGELTGRSIVKYLLSALESKVLTKAIEAVGSALSSALTKAAGNGNSVASALSAIFGHSSGGGRSSRPRIVGEEGPELLFDAGNVMNRRQLAFAMGGGGGGVSIGDTTIVVQGDSNPEQTAALVEGRIQQNNKKQLEQISRILRTNGFGSLR